MTKQDKLLSVLRTGKELTATQIEKLGFANPRAAVTNLRDRKMVAVYANKRVQKNGEVVTKYRIGTPTRHMAQLGFTS